MNDKQMLEMAAKAAGHANFEHEGSGGLLITTEDEFSYFWNPLKDDGDALRLAVKLGMTVSIKTKGDKLCTKAWSYDRKICSERHENDPYAATRRAITRAAAEIGRAL
jgi:hypothetical protein